MIVPSSFQKILGSCEKNLSRLFSDRFFLWGSFLFVYGYLVFVLVIPMLLQNTMMMWDHAGLYFSVWYEKSYVFPGIFSWNPYFYAGYAHNQFYPPLYPYLATALSYLFPITISLRIMLGVTLLLTPLSFYVCGRSLEFSKGNAAVAMLLMFALLFLFPTTYYGGNLSSTFKIGLVTHAFGMMLFFFYFASLMRAKTSGGFLLPTFLFTGIILSHIIAAVVAGLLLMSFILLYARERLFRRFLYWHIGLTFLLTAFWTLPFLAKQQYMTVIYLANNGNITLFAVFAVIYALCLILWKQFREQNVLFPLALFLLLILACALVGNAFPSFSFHFYRLMYFILLIFPLALLSLTKKSTIVTIVLVVISLILIFTAVPVSPIGPPAMETLPIQYALDGRTFVVASYDEETSPHLLQHMLPLENKIAGVKGLYVESTRNGEYLLNFEKELDEKSLSWGNMIYYLYPAKSDFITKEILPSQLSLFQINYIIISENRSRPEWQYLQEVTRYSANGKEIVYGLYRVGNASLVEVVTKPLQIVSTDTWKEESLEWFFSPAIEQKMLVDEPVPDLLGTENDSVELLGQSVLQDTIKLKVNAGREVPVLVKISYFPNWKAYQNGIPIKIYRVSPDLMMIYGMGEIELRYEELWIDSVSEWLSVVGVIIFCGMWLGSLPKKAVRKKSRN